MHAGDELSAELRLHEAFSSVPPKTGLASNSAIPQEKRVARKRLWHRKVFPGHEPASSSLMRRAFIVEGKPETKTSLNS